MHPVLQDLIHLLKLERIEDNIFRGDSRDIGSPQVFGGQVLGQALSAAQHTVEGRVAHSLHAYFLRRGDMAAPIIYEVDRARDGGSFSNRRVVAIQHGRPILNLAASFQQAVTDVLAAKAGTALDLYLAENPATPAFAVAGGVAAKSTARSASTRISLRARRSPGNSARRPCWRWPMTT